MRRPRWSWAISRATCTGRSVSTGRPCASPCTGRSRPIWRGSSICWPTGACGAPTTMADPALLVALQHGDSFFPSGASAFSWGLEALCADRQVAGADDVGQFLEGQLRHRWATCDRPFLTATHRAGGALDQVVSIDRSLAAMTL